MKRNQFIRIALTVSASLFVFWFLVVFYEQYHHTSIKYTQYERTLRKCETDHETMDLFNQPEWKKPCDVAKVKLMKWPIIDAFYNTIFVTMFWDITSAFLGSTVQLAFGLVSGLSLTVLVVIAGFALIWMRLPPRQEPAPFQLPQHVWDKLSNCTYPLHVTNAKKFA